MATITAFLDRVRDRLSWILGTARLGADIPSQIKLLVGGLWFFINDSWKSRLRFAASIEQFGRSRPFVFEDLGDFGLFREIFQSDAYDRPLPHEIQTIFDLGANVGVSALYFRLRYPDATIYCFEPDPANARRLRIHADIIGDMHVHELAVWASDETLSFYVDPHRGSSSSTYLTRSRQKKVSVKARSLESVLTLTDVEEIDLLKFDIEGAEEEVLTGIDHFNYVRALHGEVHGDLCNGSRVLDKIRAHFNTVDVVPMATNNRWYVAAHHR